DVTKGDMVTISDGPFKGQNAKVEAVDDARGKVKVFVSMFGRETSLELDFLQVKKV
ncbi:transcription termination/antitermination protein NusG, partial [bacterium]|nr:transcription termination/antitermination protein NusG [bacterium]